MQERIKLLRAARLLKETTIAYKAVMFDCDLTRVTKPVFRTRFKNDEMNPYSGKSVHVVLRLGAKASGEMWVIDTTGAQYGFSDVLVPVMRYIDQRGNEPVKWPEPYTKTETSDLDAAMAQGVVTNPTQEKFIKLEIRARKHFAQYVEGFGQKLLQGSEAEFEEKLQRFLGGVREHMMGLGEDAGNGRK
ncbi:hypothetical protein HYQ45_001305 [Verticillium longisporum]